MRRAFFLNSGQGAKGRITLFSCFEIMKYKKTMASSLLLKRTIYVFLWCYILRCSMLLCCYCECISTPGKLKNQPDHGRNRTRDLWFASPMLYQLSYEADLTSQLSWKSETLKTRVKLNTNFTAPCDYLYKLASHIKTRTLSDCICSTL